MLYLLAQSFMSAFIPCAVRSQASFELYIAVHIYSFDLLELCAIIFPSFEDTDYI